MSVAPREVGKHIESMSSNPCKPRHCLRAAMRDIACTDVAGSLMVCPASVVMALPTMIAGVARKNFAQDC